MAFPDPSWLNSSFLAAEEILRLHSTISLGIADTDCLLVPVNGMSIGLSCVRNLPSLQLLVRATFRYLLEDRLQKLSVAENLKESHTRRITLEEDDPAIVDRMVTWLYTAKYDVDDPGQDPEDIKAMFLTHAAVYVLADKYGIRDLAHRASIMCTGSEDSKESEESEESKEST